MSPAFKEKWFALSLAEQLGNLGSEVGRATKWKSKDEKSFWSAVERAMALFELVQMDPRWSKRRRELDRIRESFADAVLEGREYNSKLEDLEKYLMLFALKARS